MEHGYTLIEGDLPEPEIVEEGRLAAFKREFAEAQRRQRDDFPERAERLEALTRPKPPSGIVAGLPHHGPLRGRDLPIRVARPKIEFRISENEYEEVKVIAEAEGKSVASFARDAVRAAIYSR